MKEKGRGSTRKQDCGDDVMRWFCRGRERKVGIVLCCVVLCCVSLSSDGPPTHCGSGGRHLRGVNRCVVISPSDFGHTVSSIDLLYVSRKRRKGIWPHSDALSSSRVDFQSIFIPAIGFLGWDTRRESLPLRFFPD